MYHSEVELTVRIFEGRTEACARAFGFGIWDQESEFRV